MIHGYARVSTPAQSDQLQRDALLAAGVERVWTEQASGVMSRRPVFEALLASCVAGDTLVVWRFDRLGRSLRHLVEVVTQLNARGIELRSLHEQLDTTTATGRMMLHIFGALAEFERDLLVERTEAGLAAARAAGKRIGRPPKVTPVRRRLAADLHTQGYTITAIATELGVSRATVYRLLQPQKTGQEIPPTP